MVSSQTIFQHKRVHLVKQLLLYAETSNVHVHSQWQVIVPQIKERVAMEYLTIMLQ